MWKLLYVWIFCGAFIAIQGESEFTDLGVCDQRWAVAYSHTTSGYPVAGTVADLQTQILQGYKVRVQFSTTEWLMTFPVDDFTFRGRTICSSSMWVFSDNGTHIDTDAEWLPTLVCTNGEVSRLNYTTATWARPVGNNDVQLTKEVTWYTKPTQCDSKPVYSQFVDGFKSFGSKAKLLRLAKWSELRANMRDRGFSFLMQNQKVYNDELVTAQSLNHLSLRYTPNAVKFNMKPSYSWLSVWSSNGRRDVSRWFLENSTLYSHNNDFVSLDWYGDQCWRRVYSANSAGSATYGSLAELKQMITLGHRVRVHFDGLNLKANNIRVIGDQIVVQTTEEYARRDNYPRYDAPFFNTRARLVYRLVHSSGVVKTYKYFLETFSLSESDENSKFSIDWLVDTRPWTKVYKTDASGQVAFGTIADLKAAVTTGASVRLSVQQDGTNGQFITEADSVRASSTTDEVVAQALKHISDQKLESVDEYILPPDIFRWSVMVSSRGSVTMNARRLASKNHLYDALSPATNVTWFINA